MQSCAAPVSDMPQVGLLQVGFLIYLLHLILPLFKLFTVFVSFHLYCCCFMSYPTSVPNHHSTSGRSLFLTFVIFSTVALDLCTTSRLIHISLSWFPTILVQQQGGIHQVGQSLIPFLGGISDSLGVGYGLIDMCLQVIDLYLKVGTTYDVIFITAAL